MRIALLPLVLVFGFLPDQLYSQDEMFREKPERKKVWKKWRRNKEAYNPYLEKKPRNRPSTRQARGEKKELKRQKRQIKRQLRRAKRKTGH